MKTVWLVEIRGRNSKKPLFSNQGFRLQREAAAYAAEMNIRNQHRPPCSRLEYRAAKYLRA